MRQYCEANDAELEYLGVLQIWCNVKFRGLCMPHETILTCLQE